MTHQTCVKAEPILSEDQDLIMFYLNSDYMSTTSCWTNSQNHVSTPPTPRPTPTHGLSPISIPESQFHTKNNGVTPIIPKTLPDNDDWNNSTNSIEFFRQQEFNLSCVQPNIFTDFPFMANPQECEQPSPYIGSTDTVMYTPTMFVPHYLISQQPTSPSSLSSYSSSCSVTERPKKKRGRKKRDSTNNTAFTSNQSSSLKPGTPAMIAPAPPARQLATILPAYKPRNQPEYTNKITNCENIQLDTNVSLPHTSIKTETNSSQITSIADKTAAIDSQKAATIAKRQERLIKNRAAALLSRKRKREHLTALEDQRKDLSNANQALHQRVLELEKENFALKSKMKETNSTTSHSFERSSSEIISMVILCYFAFIISFSSKSVPGLISALENSAKLPFILSERPSPFQLESYHQNQECSENKHLECVDKSDPIFEKLVPAQKTTTESKSVSANLQDSGLGRKKFRRLSSS